MVATDKWDKYRVKAENREQFDYMLGVLVLVESKEELQRASVAYITDLSYARADISLVLNAIEAERGWR